jgi:hypothetical protein
MMAGIRASWTNVDKYLACNGNVIGGGSLLRFAYEKDVANSIEAQEVPTP